MTTPQLRSAIIHIDMDAFYASIEQLDNPDYRGKPVIVGGSADSRGVVSAASYEARKYGVHSAMPTARAQRLCPNGIFLPVRMKRYQEVSKAIHKIMRDYTDMIEPLSLDEAFLDVNGSLRLFGSAVAIGHAIKSRIKKELSLTASVGIASNKLLAKLASDYDKPDGFMVIDDREILVFLSRLPVEKLWGIGPVTREQLGKLGITQVGQLQRWSKTDLQRRFGQAHGAHLFDVCRGIDHSAVIAHRKAKSISSEHTFAVDTDDRRTIQRTLMEQCETVGRRLREQKLAGRTIMLKLRYPDFSMVTRNHSLPHPTNLDGEIYTVADQMLQRSLPPRQPIRLIGVGAAHLLPVNQPAQQLLLFDADDSSSLSTLYGAMDDICEKFGPRALRHARTLSNVDAQGRQGKQQP